MAAARTARTLGILVLPWLAVLICVSLLLHFLTHPFSTLYDPSSPPPIILLGEWLMDHDALPVGVLGSLTSVFVLAALAAWRRVGLGAGVVMLSVPFVIGLAANEWVLLYSGFEFTPSTSWILHRGVLWLCWFAFTGFVLVMMFSGRAQWRRSRAARTRRARRRARLEAPPGTDERRAGSLPRELGTRAGGPISC